MRTLPALLLLAGCLTSQADYERYLDFASDDDGDGYAEAQGDCDDDAPDTYPGAEDTWYDGVDSDCAGNNDHDRDGDGHMRVVDCDEDDDQVHPDATDSCNGVDDDCDGAVDEGLSQVWYLDVDGDGYGVSDDRVSGCLPPEGYAALDGDCDDGAPAAHPGAEPICGDDVDNNCDGLGDCGFGLEGSVRAGEEQARVSGTRLGPLRRVAILGGQDWTGDGQIDLLLGAPEASSTGANANGGVYLFSTPWRGDATLEDADHRLMGESDFDLHLGGALAFGDLHGDGAVELLVGAGTEPGSDDPYLPGFVYVVATPIDASMAPIGGRGVSEIEGESDGDEFGAALAVGDFLGDGSADFVVGAPGADIGRSATDCGQVYLVEGPIPSSDDEIEDMDIVRLTGSDAFAELRMGETLINAGDLDGDGLDELVVGVPGYSSGDRRGLVAPIFDAPEADVKLTTASGPDLQLDDGLDGRLGASLANLGDANGDGYADILVTAPDFGTGSALYSGRAWLISGSAWASAGGSSQTPDSVAEATFSGVESGDNLGASATGLGDVTGDALTDVLLGAPYAGDRDQGQSLVFESPLEGAFEATDALLSVDAISGLTELGHEVGVAGDLDGLGITELAVSWTGGDGGLLLLSPDTF